MTAGKPRKNAILAGQSVYFTGKPCKHGHVCGRTVNNGCIECQKIRIKGQRLQRYCTICGIDITGSLGARKTCSRGCRLAYNRARDGTPEKRAKKAIQQRRWLLANYEQEMIKARERARKNAHTLGGIKSRRDGVERRRERGKAALSALKSLGIEIEPLPGYTARPTEGKRITALRVLSELGIEF